MKSKTIILLGVALVCGLGAAWMTKHLLANRNQKQGEAKVFVLVAKTDLKTATVLEKPEKYFEKKAFIKGQEPKNAIKSFNQLKGKLLAQSLRKGDWVAAGNLWGQGEGAVEYRLPEGMQMFGLKVTLDRSASGFATLPGRQVDIYWVAHANRGGKSFGGLLFQRVLVMSAGTKREANDDGRAMITPVVNVALRPDDIVLAKLAEQAGSLTFALRKPGDEKEYQTLITADIIRNKLYGLTAEVEKSEVVEPTVVAQIPDVQENKPEPKPQLKLPDGWSHYYASVIHGQSKRKVLVILDEKGEAVRDPEIYQQYAGISAESPGEQPLPPPPQAPSAPQGNENPTSTDDY